MEVLRMKYLVYLVSALLLFGCASAQRAPSKTFMGKPVFDAPFVIAGGKTIHLPFTEGGPIPAENDLVAIQSAAFFIGPSKKSANNSELFWSFSFTSKSQAKFDEIRVEEVFPSSTEVSYIKDTSPVVNGMFWLRNGDPVIVSPKNIPWLYSKKPSVFVFKFTIKPKGQAPVVLYQPAFFSPESKATLLSAHVRPQ